MKPLKALADYGTGDAIVSRADAENTLAMARRFVAAVAALIPAGGPEPHPTTTPQEPSPASGGRGG